MKLFKIIILTLLLSSFLIAQDESDIIEELQDVYEDIEYFSAEFIQKELFKLTGSQNETTGKIYIKNGTEYRLETEDHTIVTDGKSVWSYSPHNNKVIVDNIKEGDASLLPRDMLFKYPKNYFSDLLKEEIGFDETTCPKCGSTDVEAYTIGKKPAFIIFLFFGFPLFFYKHGIKCSSCGEISKI